MDITIADHTLNLANADMDNRLTYLRVRKMFKEGTDNLILDHKNSLKGLTDMIKDVKKRSKKFKEILFDTKEVENKQWTTLK